MAPVEAVPAEPESIETETAVVLPPPDAVMAKPLEEPPPPEKKPPPKPVERKPPPRRSVAERKPPPSELVRDRFRPRAEYRRPGSRRRSERLEPLQGEHRLGSAKPAALSEHRKQPRRHRHRNNPVHHEPLGADHQRVPDRQRRPSTAGSGCTRNRTSRFIVASCSGFDPAAAIHVLGAAALQPSLSLAVDRLTLT